MEASTTAAAIVAGGRASRFHGQDKSRLVVEGRSIIVRQLEVLQQVVESIFVVGAPVERFADLRLQSFPDVIPGTGTLGAIYTALTVAQADAVIVTACDLPFLHAGVLRRLVELSAGHDGAWVSSGRGVEPLMACYRHMAAPRIRGRIESGMLKSSTLGDVLHMASLGEDDLRHFGPPERLLTNVNTPEDYARVQ